MKLLFKYYFITYKADKTDAEGNRIITIWIFNNPIKAFLIAQEDIEKHLSSSDFLITSMTRL